jgi:choline dehydrogenase-like flavoprotein
MSESQQFDAIVVGSGITGGWAAKELTEKGLKVLVLERGKQVEHRTGYTTEHMPPWQMPDRGLFEREEYDRDYAVQSRARGFGYATRHFWMNDRENPYVQPTGMPFNWLRTDVVGGRSLVWGRHVYRFSDLDFEANRKDGHGIDWPIRYRDIAPWYSHVEKFIGVSGRAEGLAHLPDGEFQPPMDMNVVEQAFKQRVEKRYPDRRVTIGRVAVLTQPLGDRGACHYCGPCARGCSVGAYFSSQSSTLPAATKTGNLTLRPDSLVESLEYDHRKRRVSAVRVIDTRTGARQQYTAKLVFLCASAFASVQVLLNSRSEQHPDGLANSSGTLGRYIMVHYHGVGATATMPGFEDKYYYGNRPNTLYFPRFRNLGGEESKLDFVRGYGYQSMAMPIAWSSYWHRVPGFGADFKHAMRKPGPWFIFLEGFGEHLPYADNRITLERATDRFGVPQLRFEVTFRENERRMGADILRQSVDMLTAAGAANINPLPQPAVPGTSIHEYGGARMGADPRESVVNAFNQAHDASNLFITDGASMSSSSCVNPSLTFMALTARAAGYAVEQLRAGAIG